MAPQNDDSLLILAAWEVQAIVSAIVLMEKLFSAFLDETTKNHPSTEQEWDNVSIFAVTRTVTIV